jgi:inward rectifier potassium channel
MRHNKKHPPVTRRRPRLVPRHNESLRVIRIGHKVHHLNDLYVEFLAMNWSILVGLIVSLYFFSNMLFALFYFFNFDGVQGARAGSFQDAFFFSVQTMATIGYGKMAPISVPVNIVVTIEALWGFCFFAVTTALLFAKFSQPKARVMFSNVAVIGYHDGQEYLSFRMANERTNRIVDAKASLYLIRTETTSEGSRIRRFYDLSLTRNHVPLMQLSWTLMHPLDKNSPLFGLTQEDLAKVDAEIIVSVHGHDETMSQTIYARHSYIAEEIIYSAIFEDILNPRSDGYLEVNYQLFHTVKPTNKKALL